MITSGASGAGGRRLAWIAVAVVVAAGAAAEGIAWRSSRAARCTGGEAEIAEAWGGGARAAVTAAFAATGSPRAADAATHVGETLGAYAKRWVAMRTESCQATRVRAVQSEEALALRTACLDARRDELRALAGIFAKGDAAVVERAAEAAWSLSPIEVCADVSALRVPYALPRDPGERKTVEALRTRLASAKALVATRKLEEATAALAAIVADAEGAKSPQLTGAALLLRGDAEEHGGKTEDAVRTFASAAAEANAAGDDATEATARIELVRVAGYELRRADDGETFATQAAGVLERMGKSGESLRWRLVRSRALVLGASERFTEALGLAREAVDLARRAGASPVEQSRVEVELAEREEGGGHVRAAIKGYEAALAAHGAAVGEGDAELPVLLVKLAGAELELGDAVAALAATRRVLASVGEGDAMRARAAMQEACGLLLLGDVENARRKAKEASEASEASEAKKTAGADVLWAVTALRRHLTADALAAAEAALAHGGGDAESVREGRAVHALALARSGKVKAKEGLAEATAVVAEEEKAPAVASGFEKGSLMVPLLAVGEAALGVGDGGAAVGALERAAAIADASEGKVELVADVHVALARALIATHGDAARARGLAERGAREYEATRLGGEAGKARGVVDGGE